MSDNDNLERCTNCGRLYNESVNKSCPTCAVKDDITVHTSHAGSWGILVPQNTGVTYVHQSGGVSCHQKEFEGVFLPISRPTIAPRNPHERIDLLDELRKFDYHGTDDRCDLDWDSREELWNAITDELRFTFTPVTRLTPEDSANYRAMDEYVPDDYPKFGSWKWIRIDGVKRKEHGRRAMIESWPEELEGKIVCLLYPNSD